MQAPQSKPPQDSIGPDPIDMYFDHYLHFMKQLEKGLFLIYGLSWVMSVTTEVFLHYNFGERYFNKLGVLTGAFLLLFGLFVLPNFIQSPAFVVFFGVAVAVSVVHLLLIGYRSHYAARWHSYSPGIPWLHRALPNLDLGLVMRWIEPAIVASASAMCFQLGERPLGIYFGIAAGAMFVKGQLEWYQARRMYLDAVDSQIESEVLGAMLAESDPAPYAKHGMILPQGAKVRDAIRQARQAMPDIRRRVRDIMRGPKSGGGGEQGGSGPDPGGPNTPPGPAAPFPESPAAPASNGFGGVIPAALGSASERPESPPPSGGGGECPAGKLVELPRNAPPPGQHWVMCPHAGCPDPHFRVDEQHLGSSWTCPHCCGRLMLPPARKPAAAQGLERKPLVPEIVRRVQRDGGVDVLHIRCHTCAQVFGVNAPTTDEKAYCRRCGAEWIVPGVGSK